MQELVLNGLVGLREALRIISMGAHAWGQPPSILTEEEDPMGGRLIQAGSGPRLDLLKMIFRPIKFNDIVVLIEFRRLADFDQESVDNQAEDAPHFCLYVPTI